MERIREIFVQVCWVSKNIFVVIYKVVWSWER